MANDFKEQNSRSDAKTPPLSDIAARAEGNVDDGGAGRDPFEEIATDFSERHRNGELPSVEEYVEAYPDLADEIRELFPTIVAMEQLKHRKAPAPKPTLGGLPLEQLGDFRILGEIGRGGMGVVYEAEQVSLGRHVAVKVLPQQALMDERHLRRFEREAQTAAKLHHTNIVPVFGVGQQDGYHYIVMQFIPGVGLDEILVALRTIVLEDEAIHFRMDSSSRASHATHNAKALLDGNFSKHATGGYASSFVKAESSSVAATANVQTVEIAETSAGTQSSGSEPAAGVPSSSLDDDYTAKLITVDKEFYHSIARIGQQVADALAYAHEQGTLHRDVKPGNLLLDGTGTVWVADFGLAKLAEHENVSRTGDIVGTLSYMPPESFSGEVDARGDIYALGITLYEMLAMRPAYYGRDRAKLVKQITEGDLPRLGKLNPAVPRDLETIVLKAIAHRPEDRYATARDLEEDLHAFQHDLPIQARRMSVPEQFTRWCRRNKLVASLSAAVLSLLVALTTTFGVLNWQTTLAKKKVEEQKAKVEEQKDIADSANRDLQDANSRLREEQENSKQLAQDAVAISLSYFDSLFPDRLPLSADASLNSVDPDQDSFAASAAELTGEEDTSQQEVAATVAAPPVTAASAAKLEELLKKFANLAERAGNDEHFALTFADLTLRVGKLHKLLGNVEEAREYLDNATAQYAALAASKSSDSINTAIVGLAISYNELGDLVSRTKESEAHENYVKAQHLLEREKDLLKESPRAQYELARTFFLMSVQRAHHPERGRRPGRPPGPKRGIDRERIRERNPSRSNLTKAIAILEPLVESETNPEYRYLLARCYTGLGISSWPWWEQQQHFDKATTVLQDLIEDEPDVADYKYEFAVTKLLSIRRVHNDDSKTAVAREAVEITDEIAAKNPDVSNYVRLQAAAHVTYAEVLDRYAGKLARMEDPGAKNARENMVVATMRAAEILDSARGRFPDDEEMSRQFRGVQEFDFLLAKTLWAAGERETAKQQLADVVNERVARFEWRRGGSGRLYEALEMLCLAENELSGTDSAIALLQIMRNKRQSALEIHPGGTLAALLTAEFDLRSLAIYRSIGKSDIALEIENELREKLSDQVASFDPQSILSSTRQPRLEHIRSLGGQIAITRHMLEKLFAPDDPPMAAFQTKMNELERSLEKRFHRPRNEDRRGGGPPRQIGRP